MNETDDVVLELSNVDVPRSGLALIILSKTRDPLRLPSEEESSFRWLSTSQACALATTTEHNIRHNFRRTLNLLSQHHLFLLAMTSHQ